jgi:outer membrane lipoprotein-sorting protein
MAGQSKIQMMKLATSRKTEIRTAFSAVVAAPRQSAALVPPMTEAAGALPGRRYRCGSATSRLRPLARGLGSFVDFRASVFRVFALLLLLLPALLRAGDTNAVLAAWLAAQTNVATWSADFVQTRSLKALNQPLVSTGRVWFAKPNRFRWELGQPVQTIAVRDVEQLQVIYPRLKRVERYPLADGRSGPLGEALGLLDAGFPRSHSDFNQRFRVVSLQTTNDAWLLGLQPASPSARRMLPEIRVTLAKQTFFLLANELVFPDGSRLRNDFSNAVLNPAFPSDLFQPAVGEDFKIVAPPTQ